MIEKEPITVVCSAKGWIKAMKGHGHDPKGFSYKDGDKQGVVLEAQTTDKILLFASNGRFYTLGGDKLPAGRGYGEPLSLMVDLPQGVDLVSLQVFVPGQKMIVVSSDGRGFIVVADDLIAQTKNGKQVLNVSGKAKAYQCAPIAPGHDHVATIGTNRKMLVFALEELPDMNRGKGVILQKFKEGRLSDIKSFSMEEGLEHRYGSGTTVVEDIRPWIGKRASSGRLPPNGFPKGNRF